MRVRTDDEVYRVDAVWLGPPKATFPWRARYVAWGVGILVFVLVLTGVRALFGFGFFTVAWTVVVTVVLTRLITSRISHERPLGAVFTMWMRELNAPRERPTGVGGAASATRVRMHRARPLPKHKRPVPNKNNKHGSPRRVNQSGARVSQPARSAQHVQYVQHAQNRGSARPRSKEVGGVRTQGRR
ncbi:MAG TPA: hypothetical protein VFX16_18620 [Pseudonocardiaceae bacterium]|nr:hypothetical protein [Pseudonocardiaceae bacterium]